MIVTFTVVRRKGFHPLIFTREMLGTRYTHARATTKLSKMAAAELSGHRIPTNRCIPTLISLAHCNLHISHH